MAAASLEQGGLLSEGVHTIYAQEDREVVSSHRWITTKTCAWCNKAFSNGSSAISYMCVHYRIVLVCPLCGQQGSHSYSSMRDHVKKCKDEYQELLEGIDIATSQFEPSFHKGDTHLPKEGQAPSTDFILQAGRESSKHQNSGPADCRIQG